MFILQVQGRRINESYDDIAQKQIFSAACDYVACPKTPDKPSPVQPFIFNDIANIPVRQTNGFGANFFWTGLSNLLSKKKNDLTPGLI